MPVVPFTLCLLLLSIFPIFGALVTLVTIGTMGGMGTRFLSLIIMVSCHVTSWHDNGLILDQNSTRRTILGGLPFLPVLTASMLINSISTRLAIRSWKSRVFIHWQDRCKFRK